MLGKKYPLFFVEGETEKILLDDFKRKHKDKIKRITKINLWNNDVKKILPSLTEPNDIVVIFDTDETGSIAKFIKNIKALESRKHRVYFLQQTSNFEQELLFACQCTQHVLFNEFCKKITSADNFKSSFIKCSTRLEKLNSIGFNKELLWTRELIQELKDLNPKILDYKKIIDI